MTEAIKGKTEAEIRAMFARFRAGLTAAEHRELVEIRERFGRGRLVGGVREFPVRVKCATLPWHTLVAALDHVEEPVKTE
jgi:nitrogen fixation NifU-like protein